MSKFGKALEIDTQFIGGHINATNLLVYMGMIE